MQNEMRDRIIDLLDDFYYSIESITREDIKAIAEHLISKGVVLPKKPEPPIDLKGKCGSCVFAKPTTFGKSTVYVECTNVEHIGQWCKRQVSYKRQRTHPACKRYKRKEDC